MGYKNNDPCLDRAEDDEPIFVGLGRDPLAALMTKVWAALSEDCQPSGQVTEAIEHAARMLRYCDNRNPGRVNERVTVDALDRAAGEIAKTAAMRRTARFGDVVYTRWTSVDADGSVSDDAHRAVAVQVLRIDERGDAVLSVTNEDVGGGAYDRWRQLNLATGDKFRCGWCWPHEVDLPPAYNLVGFAEVVSSDG